MNKKIQNNLIIATAFLAIIAFISGLMLGRNLATTKSDDISSFLKENELRTESYLIEQTLAESFDQNNCELARIRTEELSEELYKIGKLFEENATEETMGKENYNLLKRKYHLMQIRSYILFHKTTQNCEKQQDIIIFYFGRNDTASAEQGKILNKIVAENNIIVYAIEFNYSSDLKFLEKYYDINEQPSLIINYETKRTGLTSYEEIKQALN